MPMNNIESNVKDLLSILTSMNLTKLKFEKLTSKVNFKTDFLPITTSIKLSGEIATTVGLQFRFIQGTLETWE